MIEALRGMSPGARAGLAATTAVAGFLAWNAAASAVLSWKLGVPDADPLRAWWSYWQAYPLLRPRPGDTVAQMAAENAQVQRALLLSAAVPTLAAVGVAVNGARAAWGWGDKRQDDDSRWMTWRDARRTGFSARAGLYLGRLRGRYFRLGHAGKGQPRKHLRIVAPSQSGKGVSYIMPALLCDPGEMLSFVVMDPKMQAFTHTAGWQRAIGAEVVLFSPLSPTGQTACYNPCAYVRRGPDGSPTPDTWGDIEDVVNVQIELGTGNQVFWNQSARTAYTAILGFLAETPGADFTIPGAMDLMFRPDGPEHIMDAMDKARRRKKPYSKAVADNLRAFLTGSDELRDGIRKTIFTNLGLFFNPRVRAAVSTNTFDLRRLMVDRTALYVGVNFGDMAKLAPLLRLLFQQMVDINTRGLPGADKERRYEAVVPLDELANLGPMPKVMEAFSYAAEYGFRLMPVYQTDDQLVSVYGKEGAARITDNCKVTVVLGGNSNMRFCADVSAKMGTTKLVKESRSFRPGGLLDLWRGSVNRSEVARALMSAAEVSRLPDDEALILHDGKFPARVKRIKYYEDHRLKTRLAPPPEIEAIQVALAYDVLHGWADDGLPLPEPSAALLAKPPTPNADEARGGGKPAAKGKPKGKASVAKPPAKPDPELEMSVAQAEATLFAASGGAVDLTAFAQSPEAAKAQIDRVVHGLPTKGRGR